MSKIWVTLLLALALQMIIAGNDVRDDGDLLTQSAVYPDQRGMA